LIRKGKITPAQQKKSQKADSDTDDDEDVKTEAQTHPAGRASLPSDVLQITACPDCGSSITHETGCVVCYHCGWSKC